LVFMGTPDKTIHDTDKNDINIHGYIV
jgi:hypothetical protein